MSNGLGLAAATATLRGLLIRELGISDVTTKPPDVARKGHTSDQVNLFLYQTTIEAAWRNHDLPRQTRPGETGQPPMPLGLHYLVTAYAADDDDAKAQQLLGNAMRALHDHPLLGPEEIRQATETNVPGSNLHEQIERVRVTLQPLSLEEMSKLWAAFQTNYRLSAAYQVSVVLIESTRPTRTPLPVLTRGRADRGPVVQTGLIPPFPTLERIVLPQGRTFALLGDQVNLAGYHFALDTGNPLQVAVAVRFITTRLPDPISADILPGQRTAKGVIVDIPHQAGVFYPAGLYRVEISVAPNGRPEEVRRTNELPLLLAATILEIDNTAVPAPAAAPVSIGRVNIANGLGDATIPIKCRPDILPEQSAVLLIGDQAVNANAHTTRTDTLTFVARQIAAGTYRLRLRIDGVDSPLIDASGALPVFNDAMRVTIT